ncbi:MAG: hypothetical protein CSA97_03215 [Bacteroidetes bacterium]|nr:MAG: hypothetical protein CSA97_03215 [Bacteroidota bacterium]
MYRLYILVLLIPLMACTKNDDENRPFPDPEPGMEGVVKDNFLCLILEDSGKPLATEDIQIDLYTESGGEYKKFNRPNLAYPMGYAPSPYGDHFYIFFPEEGIRSSGLKSNLYISINGGKKNLLEMRFPDREGYYKKEAVLLNGSTIWQKPTLRLEHIRLQLATDGTLTQREQQRSIAPASL